MNGYKVECASDIKGYVCVLMPCRCVAEEEAEVVGKATAPAIAA